MVWLAVDKDGSEYIYDLKPIRCDSYYKPVREDDFGELTCCLQLPQGSISKLLGRTLTWFDDPIELK